MKNIKDKAVAAILFLLLLYTQFTLGILLNKLLNTSSSDDNFNDGLVFFIPSAFLFFASQFKQDVKYVKLIKIFVLCFLVLIAIVYSFFPSRISNEDENFGFSVTETISPVLKLINFSIIESMNLSHYNILLFLLYLSNFSIIYLIYKICMRISWRITKMIVRQKEVLK